MLATEKDLESPSFVINLQESGQISAVHFSPYELTQSLLLVAFPQKILVTQISFKNNVELQNLAEFNNGLTCTQLSLSPETTISALNQNIIFCSASVDFNLRVFESDLTHNNSCKILHGHTDYINEVSYDPENNFIASVSDDNTARVWSTHDYSCAAILYLTSAGMSICWHKEDSSKLMVAEKMGVIRFYNVNNQKPILSLDFGKPLSSAHWSPFDTESVVSLHLGELAQWDLTKPSCPIAVKLLHSMCGGFVKMSTSGELVVTVNKLERSIIVTRSKTQQQSFAATSLLPTSVTWHYRLPIFCLADDSKLCFWQASH